MSTNTSKRAFDLSVLDEPSSKPVIVTAVQQEVKNQVNVVLGLSVEKVKEDPDQPRQAFDENELQNLAQDMQKRGVQQPIIVRPVGADGMHLIVHGARRYRAAKLAGLKIIKAIIEGNEKLYDQYSQVVENTKRANLTALEIAEFMQKRKAAGDSRKKIAEELGESVGYVTSHLALAEAPELLREAFDNGRFAGINPFYDFSLWHKENPQEAEEFLNNTQGAITRQMVKDGRVPRDVAEITSVEEKAERGLTAAEESTATPYAAPPYAAALSAEDKSQDEVKQPNVSAVPYHNPELDELDKEVRPPDPNRIKKPLLLGQHSGQPIKVLLTRKPSTSGLIHIQYEDTMVDAEVSITDIGLTLLTEMKVQEKA